MTFAGIVDKAPFGGIRALSPREVEAARERVIELWTQRMDTADIAAAARLHEAWCARVIHLWREDRVASGQSGRAGK